ncbi:zinc finger protein swm [Oratosquilla oratoria]|uniref:zinc finger protein swm n=1 Tax=Oratosquilla oratoria TaxID=337810 RepID=UPI003F76C6CE
MIIENPEAFKTWLTAYLEPMCDADPEALAKYCLALVRKDKPHKELREGMVEQLDVFLQSNTRSFVERLFQVIENRDYLPKTTTPTASSSHSPDSTTATTATAPPPSTQPPPPPPPPTTALPPPPPETTPPLLQVAAPLPATNTTVPVRKEDVTTSSQKPKRLEPERDRDERRGRRRSHSPRGRTRSRSRSRERDRSRRSRSRGRSGRSKYEDRRRRSPAGKRYRRSRTRSRSRSPRRSRTPRRSRSRDHRSRSINRSLSPHRGHSGRPPHSPLRRPPSSPPKAVEEKVLPTQNGSPVAEVKGDVDDRIGGPIQSVVAELQPAKKQRCRDYDEKGYCMRGDMCPYDHGSDPVVLEGVGGVLDFHPMSGAPPHVTPGYTPAPPLPQGVPRPRHIPPPRPPQPQQPPVQQQYSEYTPSDPSLWSDPNPTGSSGYYGGRGRGRGAPPPPFPPPNQQSYSGPGRELISIPVNNGQGPKGGMRPSLAQRLGPAASGPQGRPPVPPGPKRGVDSCTLELRKIPSGLNSISHLNDHFAKFGKIVRIMVQHGGDPEAALVTFSCHSEANAAIRSTEAVLNNRFIKLFWHNPENNQAKSEATPATTTGPRSVHDRLGLRHPNKTLNKLTREEDKSEKVLLTYGSLVKTVYNPSALQSAACNPPQPASTGAPAAVAVHTVPDSTQQPPQVDAKQQEIAAILKQQELLAAEVAAKQKDEKRKADTMKLKTEVEQRKKQLLEKQMQQLKVLLAKLDTNKATMKDDEKKKMMQTIRSLQSVIETTKAQIQQQQPKSKAQSLFCMRLDQVDKEILDTELDMYTRQAEGTDVTELRSKLLTLKAQQIPKPSRGARHSPYALSRGGHYGVRGRGVRGGYRGRGRGRGTFEHLASVDHRTTKINASGFEREDKDQVLAHFAKMGSIVNYDWDDATPAVTVQYATRREAERTMTEGRNLEDRLLTVTWVNEQQAPSRTSSQQVPPVMPAPHSTTPTLEEITEEIVEVEDTDVGENNLIFEEEEELEEEEEENRSWRR